MTSKPEWHVVEQFRHLQWAKTSEEGTLLVRDMRDPDSEELVTGKDAFVRWIAEHSKTDEFLPIGDWIKTVTVMLGLNQCTPCAQRQAFLNRFFPRFR